MDCCSTKKRIRTEAEKKKIENHLNRIIGQMQGVKKMIADDRYCGDILIQLSAVAKSVKSLATNILDDHLHSCIVNSIKQGDESAVDEIMELFKRF